MGLRVEGVADGEKTMATHMAEVSRHATTIHYEVVGEGPTIVLLHSFLCDRTMWRHQVPPLVTAGWQVVNVDMRGHGLSGPALQPFSIYDLADDVVAVLDDVGVERAVWCGLSIGGMTALRAVLGHRDRVRALVLADSDGGAEDAVGKARNLAFAVTQRAVGQRPLLATPDRLFLSATTRRDRPELVEELHVRWVSNHRPSMSNAIRALNKRDDVLPMLLEVDVPTLVVVGSEDEGLPPDRSKRLADTLPNARLVRIDGAGHLSCLEHPLECNTALLGFLDDLG